MWRKCYTYTNEKNNDPDNFFILDLHKRPVKVVKKFVRKDKKK